MKRLIALVPKSPWRSGRFGPQNWQDWHRQCVQAARVARPGDELVVSSKNFFPKVMSCPEELYYASAVHALGASLSLLGRGTETISHLQAVDERARELGAELLLVVTWTHALRVWYILRRRRIHARMLVVFGLPRPLELITDSILTLAYPAFDLLGYGSWFEERVLARRGDNKL